MTLELSSPAGGVCSRFPTCSQEGELFGYRDNWDESVFLGGIECGSGHQYLLWRNGSDHCWRRQNLLCNYDEVGGVRSLEGRRLGLTLS